MNHPPIDCATAHLYLSARHDGEGTLAAPLDEHLARCTDCRAHERALAALSGGFAALRADSPATDPSMDLWPRIERAARPPGAPRAAPERALRPLLARAAALLLGCLGLGSTALLVERNAPQPEPAQAGIAPARHLLEHLAETDTGAAPSALFAALPEYRLLRGTPAAEDVR